MHITLNGNLFDSEDSITVGNLLNQLNLTGKLAVEINNNIIPRSRFTSHIIQPNDRVEIVNAIGGG